MLRADNSDVDYPPSIPQKFAMVSGSVKAEESIRFGDGFEFNLRSRTLRRAGRVLKLERIPSEILFCLIEQKGAVVRRAQIVERIWGKGVFLDTDNSINGAIRKIRLGLKDDAEQPQYIQTITGQGYRFIASVVDPSRELVKPEDDQTAVDPEPPVVEPVPEMPAGDPGIGRWILITAACATLLSVTTSWWVWFHAARRPRVTQE